MRISVRPLLLLLALLLCAHAAHAQRTGPASKEELAAITERGRQLAAYDAAAWHATDAVLAAKPAEGSVARYLARKEADGWHVAFGRLNAARDRFLIAYEAVPGSGAAGFGVRKYDSPKEDTGFYLFSARAVELALGDFKGEARPYNVAVLPAPQGQLYVYVVPAQTKHGVYPLGGDARYLVSADGNKLIEKRQLHKAIIEFTMPDGAQQPVGGYHTAVLDDVPEDTDVFHVLARRPSVPQWIGTRQYVYRVEPDGAITYVMTMEAFRKIKP